MNSTYAVRHIGRSTIQGLASEIEAPQDRVSTVQVHSEDGAADLWRPCPFCGAEIEVGDDGCEHPSSVNCPLDMMWLANHHRAAWNRRAGQEDADAASGQQVRALSQGFAEGLEAATELVSADYICDAIRNVENPYAALTPAPSCVTKTADQPTQPDLRHADAPQAPEDRSYEMAEAAAFSAGYEAGERDGREAEQDHVSTVQVHSEEGTNAAAQSLSSNQQVRDLVWEKGEELIWTAGIYSITDIGDGYEVNFGGVNVAYIGHDSTYLPLGKAMASAQEHHQHYVHSALAEVSE